MARKPKTPKTEAMTVAAPAAMASPPAPFAPNPLTVAPLLFNEEQRKIIRDTCARGATDLELAALLEICAALRLNPLLKQIHFRKQKARNPTTGEYEEVWITIIGIDGLRLLAQRTGRLDGIDEPGFEYRADDAEHLHPQLARVAVYCKDMSRPVVGVARFREFAQYTGKGELVSMWSKMPHNQLQKCAEAAALRRAFPAECGSLYLHEELPPLEEIRAPNLEGFGAPAAIGNTTAGALPAATTGFITADLLESFNTASCLEELDHRARKLPGAIGKADRDALERAYRARKAELKAKEAGEAAPAETGA